MKKLVLAVLFPLLLSCSHTPPSAMEVAAKLDDPPVATEPEPERWIRPSNDALCGASEQQAYDVERYLVDKDQNLIGTVPKEGQCVENLCVTKEEVGDCGQIVQLVSINGRPIFIVTLLPVYFVYAEDAIDVVWEMVEVKPVTQEQAGGSV